MTKIVYRLLPKDYREYWIWNETPFPAGLPTWDQLAEALPPSGDGEKGE